MGHDKALTSKHCMHIQGDLAGKLLKALAHAEVSNALHIAVATSSGSDIADGGIHSEQSMRCPYITVTMG